MQVRMFHKQKKEGKGKKKKKKKKMGEKMKKKRSGLVVKELVCVGCFEGRWNQQALSLSVDDKKR